MNVGVAHEQCGPGGEVSFEATERGYGDGPRWVNWVLPGTPRHRTKDNHEFGVICLRELPVLIACCDFPPRIYDYWMANIATAFWYTPDVESLCAIHLNTRRRATGFHLVGIGTLDTVLFSPRELFRTAILRNAWPIVVAHSHQSGDPRPSDADIRATRELVQTGRIIRIEIFDHVVIGQSGPDHPRQWASLREMSLLY